MRVLNKLAFILECQKFKRYQIQFAMSLFIIGSVSRVTSHIVHHLAKNSQYSAVTIADVLPVYEFHNRFYRLQRQLDEGKHNLKVTLDRLNTINDLKKSQNFDDVLFVTHDYYESVVSKTKLMQLTALACKRRKHLYFATPAEYDHFGFANPEANYQQAENKVFQINPNSTVIRSDIQDGTETLLGLQGSPNANFKPKIVKSSDFAKTVCETIAAKVQGKRILVRGTQSAQRSSVRVDTNQFKHAKENLGLLATKYSGYKFSGYDNSEAQQKKEQVKSN